MIPEMLSEPGLHSIVRERSTRRFCRKWVPGSLFFPGHVFPLFFLLENRFLGDGFLEMAFGQIIVSVGGPCSVTANSFKDVALGMMVPRRLLLGKGFREWFLGNSFLVRVKESS